MLSVLSAISISLLPGPLSGQSLEIHMYIHTHRHTHLHIFLYLYLAQTMHLYYSNPYPTLQALFQFSVYSSTCSSPVQAMNYLIILGQLSSLVTCLNWPRTLKSYLLCLGLIKGFREEGRNKKRQEKWERKVEGRRERGIFFSFSKTTIASLNFKNQGMNFR